MRVRCAHGYFFFHEDETGELARFASRYELSIVPKDWYYTFETLADAPNYSLKNLSYLGTPASERFSGQPWEVMRKNRLVYDFSDDTVKPIASVTTPLVISESRDYLFAGGLLLPGSVNSRGQRVTDFTGTFASDGLKFRYTEVLYDQNS